MVSFLLSKGAQINVQDKMGRTPAMMATELGNEAMLNLLIENNADLTLRDREGQGDEGHTHTMFFIVENLSFFISHLSFQKQNPNHLSCGQTLMCSERFSHIKFEWQVLPCLPAHKYIEYLFRY